MGNGLANEELDNRVDLKVTTDYRHILGEVVEKRFKTPKIASIFPGFDNYKALGILG